MSARIFQSLDDARGQFGPSAVAIGNFDGVHVGHQELIKRALASAREDGLVPSVLTFHPHPTSVVAPARTPEMICSLQERIELLVRYGAQHVMVLPFTPGIAAMTPRDFTKSVLVDTLSAKAVIVGENFVFGREQSGKVDTLRNLGSELSFKTNFLKPVFVRGELVSSSAIRKHLRTANVSRAGRLLGRTFAVKSEVVRGQGIGSKQTVPTLNQKPVPGQIYPSGVFVTETLDLSSGRRWESITNVGTRPTFSGDQRTVETFLLSAFEGDSPRNIQVNFLRYLRQEQQFEDPAALRSQIMRDVSRAQKFWRIFERFKQTSERIY
jgi:riboflavin kinase / FMN adenylyltransferase